MNYILTPHFEDFVLTCEKHGLPYKRGHSNPNILFVHDAVQLIGRRIFKHDKVIKGAKFDDFGAEIINRIGVELAIRTEK